MQQKILQWSKQKILALSKMAKILIHLKMSTNSNFKFSCSSARTDTQQNMEAFSQNIVDIIVERLKQDLRMN